MSAEKTGLIPLKDAAEKFGATDQQEFKRSCKQLGVWLSIAGLDFVDWDKFLVRVKEVAAEKVEKAMLRKNQKPTAGRSIGLLRARITRAPKLIKDKEAAINAAAIDVENAPNNYKRSRAKKALLKLEEGLIRLRENLERDQEELDRILDEEPEE